MATVNFYSKEQIDEKIPDTTGASQGDVLTIGASGTEWATPATNDWVMTTNKLSSYIHWNSNHTKLTIDKDLKIAMNQVGSTYCFGSIEILAGEYYASSSIEFYGCVYTHTSGNAPIPIGLIIMYSSGLCIKTTYSTSRLEDQTPMSNFDDWTTTPNRFMLYIR